MKRLRQHIELRGRIAQLEDAEGFAVAGVGKIN